MSGFLIKIFLLFRKSEFLIKNQLLITTGNEMLEKIDFC